MAPQSLRHDSAAGTIEILWQDGSLQQLGSAFLRMHCQCALCKSAGIASQSLDTTDTDIAITQIVPVGRYAVQLHFSDGHARGIYPWAFLKSLRDASFVMK